MLKLKISIVLLFLTSLTQAQIKIESKHMPSADDTARLSIASALSLPSGWQTPGAQKSWDFSKIEPTATRLQEYKSSLRTTYAFYFFNQIGEKIADTLGGGPLVFTNVQNFYVKNNNVFKAMGIGYTASGIPLASQYSDEDEIYQFPLEYNDSDVSTFRFKFEVPGQQFISYLQKGTRTNVVDAWGSITTPYKTYKDVIRVKTILDQVDSLVTPLGNTPIPRRQLIYKWLSTDEKVPVLEIRGTLVNGTYTPSEVLYRDSFQGLPDIFNPTEPTNIRVDFSVDKNLGLAAADVFKFTNKTQPTASAYTWIFEPADGVGFVSNTTANLANPQVIFKNAGAYSVTLRAQFGPGVTRDTTFKDMISVSWGAFTQRHENNPNPCVIVFPNPATQVLNLNFTCPTFAPVIYPDHLIVVDVSGKSHTIYRQQNAARDDEYRVDHLAAGLYKVSFMGLGTHFMKN
jgi:hypothetical protein